jgi:parallel beta-helix repeat protein
VFFRKFGLRLAVGALAALATGLGLAWSTGLLFQSGQGRGHLYVSARGSDRSSCTRSRPCRSIVRAVAVAHPGEEVDVEPGSYREQVLVTKRLTIRGFHSPTIDASGRGRGILLAGARAAGSVVQGLVIQNAIYEGILVLGTTRVTIAHNVVRDDDRGFFNHQFTGECGKNGQPPGVAVFADLRSGGCGEAIHLASSSYARVVGNLITGNTGGIYLTDEAGPAAHNLIVGNRVLGNAFDCGITLASHSHRAVTATGQLQPRVGGVYDNTIKGNVANGNGVRLSGAGILVAAAFTGGAAYGNVISGNTVNGNGLPGVALHSHDPHQNLNGNVIRDNIVGRNALGDPNSGPGDDDAGIHHTAGILVWSAFSRITRLQVSGNRISGNYFGIWTQNAPPMPRAANHYSQVRVPLSQH